MDDSDDKPMMTDPSDERFNEMMESLSDEELIDYTRKLASYLHDAGMENVLGLECLADSAEAFEKSVKDAALAEERCRIVNAKLERQADMLLKYMDGSSGGQYYAGPRNTRKKTN